MTSQRDFNRCIVAVIPAEPPRRTGPTPEALRGSFTPVVITVFSPEWKMTGEQIGKGICCLYYAPIYSAGKQPVNYRRLTLGPPGPLEMQRALLKIIKPLTCVHTEKQFK